MPYSDINTNLDDLTAGFNISTDLKNTLTDYDPSGEKNLWGQLGTQKSLMQDQLSLNQSKASSTVGKGFSGSGQRGRVQETMSQNVNDKFGGMLDNTMYDEYKLKKSWQEKNLATIAGYVSSGDVTINNVTGGGNGNDGSPSGWTGGTPSNGTTHTDDDGVDWIYENGSWSQEDSCFIEGTKIFMSNGSEKNIEDIVEGDLILSFDEDTKSFTPGIVTDHLIHPVGREIPVAIVGGILEGTPSHPIFFNGNWSEIKESEVGTKIVRKYIENYYNLEVDGYDVFGSSHNYIANGYVVSGLGDNAVLNDTFQRQKLFQKKEGVGYAI